MFEKDKKLYLDDFTLASRCIRNIMPNLLDEINKSGCLDKKLFQINFRANSNNIVLVTLIYHKLIDDEMIDNIESISKKLNINLIVRSKNYIYRTSDNFFEDFINNVKVYQTDNCFYQPNKFLLTKMINRIELYIENPKDLLELYCGVGTFTLQLANKFNRIFATESNRESIKCLDKAIAINKLTNIYKSRLSAEELDEAFNGRSFFRMKDINLNEFNFSHVLVDPPRSGLTDEVINLISKFKNIIYISCNGETYLGDIKKLRSHKIKKIEIFDQFPNTRHIEVVSLLSAI
jgi:tRNA (uracil-5-)-methyltransferase